MGGLKAGCFKIGHTGGMLDNILMSKLYRPGRYPHDSLIFILRYNKKTPLFILVLHTYLDQVACQMNWIILFAVIRMVFMKALQLVEIGNLESFSRPQKIIFLKSDSMDFDNKSSLLFILAILVQHLQIISIVMKMIQKQK